MKRIVIVEVIPHEKENEIVFVLEDGKKIYQLESDIWLMIERTGI